MESPKLGFSKLKNTDMENISKELRKALGEIVRERTTAQGVMEEGDRLASIIDGSNMGDAIKHIQPIMDVAKDALLRADMSSIMYCLHCLITSMGDAGVNAIARLKENEIEIKALKDVIKVQDELIGDS